MVEQLVKDNIKLVYFVYYRNCKKLHENYQDEFIMEGYRGLLQAAKSYDKNNLAL